MKIQKIKVPFYKWEITVIDSFDFSDLDEVVKQMKKHRLTEEHIQEVKDKYANEAMDGAICYMNTTALYSIVIVFPHHNIKQRVSTLVHESRHLADDIIEAINLEGPESRAYLNEYIAFEMIKDYIKDEVSQA
jgi:hypothetical protein